MNFREFIEQNDIQESWWKWSKSNALTDTDSGLDDTKEFTPVKKQEEEPLWALPCTIQYDNQSGKYLAIYENPRGKLFAKSRDLKKLYQLCSKTFYTVSVEDGSLATRS